MRTIVKWLVAQWISRFQEITLTMGDLQLKMHVADLEDSAVTDDLLWWEQPFSCSPASPVWVGAPEETWTEVGKIILAAAGVDPAPVSEIQSTYLEMVRQSMGSLAQDIGERISSQVSSEKGAEKPPKKNDRQIFQIEAETSDQTVRFYLVISNELCNFVSSSTEGTGAAAPDSPQAQHQAEPQQSEYLPANSSRTFELLLDVELPVSVSFGHAALKLQDAMKLITGSLIELDRGVTDPVELLVNNCVIARGEVVVVEGNYGVRIIEIISQKERLQQTRRYMLQ